MSKVFERFAPQRLDAAVSQACRECSLDLTHMSAVYAFLDEDEDSWTSCCGSACDPCVASLGAAARRALHILERDA
ncbi:MAG: hypothetical protein U0326_38860 [Polyangiales bacterium]